mgnify:CR=1 FL=1
MAALRPALLAVLAEGPRILLYDDFHQVPPRGIELMATLVHALKARGKKYGLQTMCEGGGVANALTLLGDEPFYVANSDALLLNGPHPILPRLTAGWDDEKMDGLLLLHSTVEAFGYEGYGDFCAEPDGLLTRRPESEVSPWLFTGVQILHPRLFKDLPEGPLREAD